MGVRGILTDALAPKMLVGQITFLDRKHSRTEKVLRARQAHTCNIGRLLNLRYRKRQGEALASALNPVLTNPGQGPKERVTPSRLLQTSSFV